MKQDIYAVSQIFVAWLRGCSNYGILIQESRGLHNSEFLPQKKPDRMWISKKEKSSNFGVLPSPVRGSSFIVLHGQKTKR
jgi:hypothetical protein